MSTRRVCRLNSLLKEVISEVLRKDLHHIAGVTELLTITSVDMTADLRYAKVYFSMIGDQKAKEDECRILNAIAGQITHIASRKIRIRTFPKLHFYIDEGLEKQLRICDILAKVAPPTQDSTSEPSLAEPS